MAHFAEREDTWLTPHFGRAAERAALSRRCLAGTAAQARVGFADLARQLRRHADEGDAEAWPDSQPPLAGSNRDLCMHAAGFIRRSQTTGSMIVRLAPNDTRAAFTGTSSPCLSIFKPAGFGDRPYRVLSERDDAAPLWAAHERVHRRALFDDAFRDRLRQRFAQAEEEVFAALEAKAPDLSEADARAWQAQQLALDECPELPVYPRTRHGRYWRRQPAAPA